MTMNRCRSYEFKGKVVTTYKPFLNMLIYVANEAFKIKLNKTTRGKLESYRPTSECVVIPRDGKGGGETSCQ